MKRRTALLILLVVLTVIPTGVFLVILSTLVPFVLSNLGNISIFQHGDTLEISSGRIRFSAPLSIFIGLVLSTIIFFASVLLLIRGWLIRRSKKQKMRESYTA